MDRFWNKVDVRGEDDCWEWKASRNKKGYGYFWCEGRWKAHRFSWVLAYGDIPEHDSHHGLCVLHKCDNPSCVNPKHLFLGTVADNNRDMQRKGRCAKPDVKGVKHPRVKLTEEQVRYILSSPINGKAIAKELGVTQANVSSIRTRKTWSHIE